MTRIYGTFAVVKYKQNRKVTVWRRLHIKDAFIIELPCATVIILYVAYILDRRHSEYRETVGRFRVYSELYFRLLSGLTVGPKH